MSLAKLGMPEEGIEIAAKLAIQNPYPNPRPVTEDGIRALLARAYTGAMPQSAELEPAWQSACAARPRRMPRLFGRFSARRAPARWISRNISANAAPFVSPGPRGVKRAGGSEERPGGKEGVNTC